MRGTNKCLNFLVENLFTPEFLALNDVYQKLVTLKNVRRATDKRDSIGLHETTNQG